MSAKKSEILKKCDFWFDRHIRVEWNTFSEDFIRGLFEASLLDRIKVTKNRLKFDRIKMTTTNVNIGTWPKLYNDEH